MDMVIKVQILDEAISLLPNTLGKVRNPTILPPAVGEIVGQTVHFKFGMATRLGEEKL